MAFSSSPQLSRWNWCFELKSVHIPACRFQYRFQSGEPNAYSFRVVRYSCWAFLRWLFATLEDKPNCNTQELNHQQIICCMSFEMHYSWRGRIQYYTNHFSMIHCHPLTNTNTACLPTMSEPMLPLQNRSSFENLSSAICFLWSLVTVLLW